MTTLYWHDYETWGEVPARDRPSQFAGIRTDLDLNPLGQPLMLYCRPAADVLPKPEACLVTGLSPQKALAEGLPEPEFIAAIHAELALPGTCGVGYNSLRFDDEVTRYTLYRNFYDPYEREWRNGNSRWDIIDMVRLTRALRPDGIQWPKHADGRPSFRLEDLTAANGISHAGAHDALADVRATIALAKLIKTRQPKLYQHVFELRRKQNVAALIDLKNRQPLLHVSSRFAAENGCVGLVAPLAMHPVNKNAVIVCNLALDPSPLLTLSAAQIQAKLYQPSDQLAAGEERIPLKLVHLNKCPILTTVNLLDAAAAARLGIDKEACERHWQKLRQADLEAKLKAVFANNDFAEAEDPEQQLYAGFLQDADKRQFERLRRASPEQLGGQGFDFKDQRLKTLLFRYRARNYPQTLSAAEQQQWQAWRRERLTNPAAGGSLTLAQLAARIATIEAERELNAAQQLLLQDLQDYAAGLLA